MAQAHNSQGLVFYRTSGSRFRHSRLGRGKGELQGGFKANQPDLGPIIKKDNRHCARTRPQCQLPFIGQRPVKYTPTIGCHPGSQGP